MIDPIIEQTRTPAQKAFRKRKLQLVHQMRQQMGLKPWQTRVRV